SHRGSPCCPCPCLPDTDAGQDSGERERAEMPELPEVEAARRALEAHCVGRRITRCAVADDPKVVVAAAGRVTFERAMVGRTIVAARRRGKNLWLRLDAPPFPSFQFGMAGAIYIKGVAVTKYKRSAVNSEDEWPSKYSKFFVECLYKMVNFSLMMAWSFLSLIRGALQEFGYLMILKRYLQFLS
uniref:Formamidopyrimidine-DNA glycosylase catalytic domain-containing protein n=1 Tax=Aegilops tauschii subsp. strangulata TaxID=200361 RepID=A0A453T6Y7_AEGTS